MNWCRLRDGSRMSTGSWFQILGPDTPMYGHRIGRVLYVGMWGSRARRIEAAPEMYHSRPVHTDRWDMTALTDVGIYRRVDRVYSGTSVEPVASERQSLRFLLRLRACQKKSPAEKRPFNTRLPTKLHWLIYFYQLIWLVDLYLSTYADQSETQATSWRLQSKKYETMPY